MADVFVEYSELEISRSDVEASTDIAELTDWMKEQRQVAAEVSIMINALKGVPDARTLSLSRKLGFVRMSMMWIGNRLRELGVDPEEAAPRHSPGIKAHLAAMEKAIQGKNVKIKAQNLEIIALRSEVAALKKQLRMTNPTPITPREGEG